MIEVAGAIDPMPGEVRKYREFQKRMRKSRFREDLAGKVFGRLVALRVAEDYLDIARGQRRWWARCLCGNEILVAAKSLKSGNTKSCGCLRMRRSAAKVATQLRSSDGKFKAASRDAAKVICPVEPIIQLSGIMCATHQAIVSVSVSQQGQGLGLIAASLLAARCDSDTRRQAETGTGSVRSTGSAGRQASPGSYRPNPTSR